MAYDKAVDSAALDAGLTAIANAIRQKAGSSDALAFPDAMAAAIAAIQTGAEIANYYVFGGSFTPAEDVSNTLDLATNDSLGLPSGHIYEKRDYLFGAIWSTGGYLKEANYINAAMTAPKLRFNESSMTNSFTGAVLKETNTASRAVIMFNGAYPAKVSLTCDASYMLKAGVEYAWAAFIPKG